MNRIPALVLFVVALVSTQAPAWETNDWQFIETIQRANLRFFQEQKRGPYDLVNDTADYDAPGLAVPPYSSVAGVGFELTAICLGHYRGWVSYADAYEQVLKAAHTFNLLDARGAISVTERAVYIRRIRNLACSVAASYLDSRARLKFPMAPRAWADETLAALAKKAA